MKYKLLPLVVATLMTSLVPASADAGVTIHQYVAQCSVRANMYVYLEIPSTDGQEVVGKRWPTEDFFIGYVDYIDNAPPSLEHWRYAVLNQCNTAPRATIEFRCQNKRPIDCYRPTFCKHYRRSIVEHPLPSCNEPLKGKMLMKRKISDGADDADAHWDPSDALALNRALCDPRHNIRDVQ